MRILILCFACIVTLGTSSSFALVTPQKAMAPVSEVPVGALCSNFPPKGSCWVKAKILEQTDDDTYLIKDRTGQITLFLPTDELLSYDLRPGMEILILGSVDVSCVKPEKNEFYAERILLPQNVEVAPQ